MKTRAMALSVVAMILGTGSIAWSAGNLVVNPGFEATEDLSAPTGFGDWGGNPASVVIAEQGISPYEGSRMLRFDFTSSGSGPSEHIASEVWQFVDLSGCAALIAQGDAVAVGRAYVNRVTGDSQTDTRLGINLYAFQGDPVDFQLGGPDELARLGGSILTDGDPDTWELSLVEMALPTGTTYVAVWAYANESVFNDTTGVEFDGHYCDNVTLEVVPEPATLALLAAGGLGILLRRRRARA